MPRNLPMLASIRRSLRTKVMVLVLATTVSALLLSAAGLVVYDLRAYERQASEDAQERAEVIARWNASALVAGDRRAGTEALSALRARNGILAAAIYTNSGEIFATYERPGAVPVPFPSHPQPEGYRIEDDHLVAFHRVMEEGKDLGTVYLLTTYEPWDRLRDYLGIIGVVMIVSLGVALFFSGWLQRAITDPVLEVAHAESGRRAEAHSDGAGKGSERAATAAAPAAGEQRQSRRILLADDNVDFANSLAAQLAEKGHEVRVAHDGAEALQTAARFNPDFAFLDIGMPKVHGYEVARRLREHAGAECVLVALTGWGQEDDRRRVREAGFDRHLVKPVDIGDIDAILKSY